MFACGKDMRCLSAETFDEFVGREGFPSAGFPDGSEKLRFEVSRHFERFVRFAAENRDYRPLREKVSLYDDLAAYDGACSQLHSLENTPGHVEGRRPAQN